MSSKIIVANTGEDSITIVDLTNNNKIKTIPLTSLINKDNKLNIYLDTYHIGPYDLCIGSNKKNIFLTNVYDNSLFKIDIDSMKIQDVLPVGKFPIAAEVYGGLIFVINSDSNCVSIIDEESFKNIENISLGEKPIDIFIDKNNEKAYIANGNGYSVDVIDLKKDTLETIKLNKNPIKVQIENNLLYVLSNINNGVLNCSDLSIIDIESNVVQNVINLNGIYNNMVKLEGKEFVYITSQENGYIYKINLCNFSVSAKKKLDGMPNKILTLNKQLLLISNISKNCIIIFDSKSDKILEYIQVGKEPNGLVMI